LAARSGGHRLGWAATLGARVHQVALPKPNLRQLIWLAREVGAVGVNVAHVGTMVGLLFEHGADDQADVTSVVRRRAGEAKAIGWHRIVGGGPTALNRKTRSEDA